MATKPPAVTVRNSWAALAEEEERDGRLCDDNEDAADDADGLDHMQEEEREGAGEDEEEKGLLEAELKSIWLSHCSVLRRLEADTRPAPPRLLAKIKAERDAAERRWRAAKTPHPLHKRLRWAEAELRAAEAMEAARRRELADHVEQAPARTGEIEARLEVDAARTARKRSALEKLHCEGGMGERPAMEKAARLAVAGIGTDIAPALTAIIEQLGEADEGLRQDLQVLSTSLGRVEGVLREATENELVLDQRRRQQQ